MWAITKRGRSLEDAKRIRCNERMSNIELLLMKDVYGNICYMLSIKDTQSHTQLGEWTGRQNDTLHLHHIKFIDCEMKVHPQSEWMSHDTAEKLKAHFHGQDIYSTFNLNQKKLESGSLRQWERLHE